MLYYELYIAGAVAPDIISGFGMTFSFYVYISVAGNAVGAFGSLAAGLADRWGRANLVAYGLVITAVLALFGIPNATTKWEFAVIFAVDRPGRGRHPGRDPALVRDFSPQLGRASAMGFWTLGPVVGSLVVAVVSSNTLSHLHAWQDQFIICGIVGLVIAAVALVGLRELSPQLRDQLMVSMRDRALIEAKARGIDITESLKRPVEADAAPGCHRVGVRHLGIPDVLLHGRRLLRHLLRGPARLLAVAGQQPRRLVLGVRRGGADHRRDHLRPAPRAQAVHGHRRDRRDLLHGRVPQPGLQHQLLRPSPSGSASSRSSPRSFTRRGWPASPRPWRSATRR